MDNCPDNAMNKHRLFVDGDLSIAILVDAAGNLSWLYVPGDLVLPGEDSRLLVIRKTSLNLSAVSIDFSFLGCCLSHIWRKLAMQAY